MVEHMMLFEFPSSHHMVFGMLCTFSLTVLIFEQHRAQLRCKPRTSTCFSQCQVFVFRKMSFQIHFNFSPLTGIFILLTIWWNYITWLRLCLLKSLLTMIQHMHCLLVFRKMSFPIHLNFSHLAGIISWSLFDEITLHGYV